MSLPQVSVEAFRSQRITLAELMTLRQQAAHFGFYHVRIGQDEGPTLDESIAVIRDSRVNVMMFCLRCSSGYAEERLLGDRMPMPVSGECPPCRERFSGGKKW